MISKSNILLAFFLGIILSVLLWYGYSYIHNKPHNVFHSYDIENGDFFGTTSNGKTYNLKADYIIKTGKNTYQLNKVYAKYYMDKKTDNYIEVLAMTGFFNESKNLLSLNGNVEFILSQGYRMLTESFFIDMKKDIAFTKEEVLLSGVEGKILSKTGITIYMKQNKSIFHGPIQSIFIENQLTN